MNQGFFTGRMARDPKLLDSGVCYVTLIRNEYAGRDAHGGAKERTVAVSFTAFGGLAQALGRNARKGDQLVVRYRLVNNEREREPGKVDREFSFVLEEFEFGAPGELKRNQLAQSQGR